MEVAPWEAPARQGDDARGGFPRPQRREVVCSSFGETGSTSLCCCPSRRKLRLPVSWASAGCQLSKLRSVHFPWKGTCLAASRGALLSAASEVKPGSGPHWFVGCPKLGAIPLVFSRFSLCPSVFPWCGLLCPPNLHAPDRPPRGSNLPPRAVSAFPWPSLW